MNNDPWKVKKSSIDIEWQIQMVSKYRDWTKDCLHGSGTGSTYAFKRLPFHYVPVSF
jgi:hypothetical protein